MKILHLLYESIHDPFGIGGVGFRAYEIYKRLKERHDVTLLCKKYRGAKDGKAEELRHIFVGAESKSLTKTLLSYAYHASKFVKRHSHEYDIIVEEFSPAIPTFSHAFTQKPLVLQIQGHTGKLYFRKYNPFYALSLYLMEILRPMVYDNFIFINSETMKRFSLKKKKHIDVIPNGVSPDMLTIPFDEKDYILYLGRIDIYGKGLDVLLDAYSEFVKSFPAVRLIIAGDGRDNEAFQSMLAKLPNDVRNNIEIPGWVSNDKKREVLSKALYVVFPSRHEVQPLSVLEAIGSGKAVIVSNLPEFQFISDIQAGLSFESGNSDSLKLAMKKLISSDQRREIGLRGRNWAKDLTWDTIALKYENFLYRIAEK